MLHPVYRVTLMVICFLQSPLRAKRRETPVGPRSFAPSIPNPFRFGSDGPLSVLWSNAVPAPDS